MLKHGTNVTRVIRGENIFNNKIYIGDLASIEDVRRPTARYRGEYQQVPATRRPPSGCLVMYRYTKTSYYLYIVYLILYIVYNDVYTMSSKIYDKYRIRYYGGLFNWCINLIIIDILQGKHML